MLALLAQIGGLPRHVRDMGGTEADMKAILEEVREAYAGFMAPDGLRIPAVVQIYTAIRQG